MASSGVPVQEVVEKLAATGIVGVTPGCTCPEASDGPRPDTCRCDERAERFVHEKIRDALAALSPSDLLGLVFTEEEREALLELCETGESRYVHSIQESALARLRGSGEQVEESGWGPDHPAYDEMGQ